MHRQVNECGEAILHNNHDGPPASGRHRDTSLSTAQKIMALNRFGVNTSVNRAEIADDMILDKLLSPAQEEELQKTKRAIGDFLKGAKQKHFKHQWNNSVMVDAQLVEVVDSIACTLNDHLRNPQPFTPPSNTSDTCTQNGNYFLESNLYHTLGENMFVVDHDYAEGGAKGHIVFAPWDLEERCYKAASMHLDEDEEGREILFGCDWYELEPGLQVGHAGFYDCDGHYIPCVYETAKHENATKSVKSAVA